MDFEMTQEQNALRDAVRAVLARHCPIRLVRELVEKGVRPPELWGAMVDLGWPALTVPTESGGLGGGCVELAIVAEELGRVAAPGPLLATISQFAPAIRETGSDAQRERFLAPVAAGISCGTLAVAEQPGEWSPAAVSAVARPSDDGWVIHGTKSYVIDGATADEVAVAARLEGTEGDDGIGLFVVPGALVKAVPLITFDATQEFATLDLDGVIVGPDRTLGPPGSAAPALRRALDEATVAVAASTVGTCQTIFDSVLAYAKVRVQFGVPIGSFQAVKHKLADMFVALERARALVYFAALAIADDDDRRAVATSAAKVAAGDCQRLVVQDGLQLMGGIGYTWEYDLHLYLKRAKAGDAVLGTATMHRALVAGLMGLGRSVGTDPAC